MGIKVLAVLAAVSFLVTAQAAAGDFPVKAVAPIPDLPFFRVNDNRVTYAYIFDGTDPGVTGHTAKQVYAFTHFDTWAYGTNLANIAMYKSDHSDPANGCKGPDQGCAGATEIYGFIRSTFGFNEIFNTRAFTVGPLRNISFEVGADFNTINTPLAPNKRAIYAGLQFAFDLPYKGYINFAPMAYKEIQHNGLAQGPLLPSGQVEYQTTWAFESNYYMDLGFLPPTVPLAISGNLAIRGPKGPQSAPIPFTVPTNIQTKTEIFSEPVRLTLDVSRMAFGPKYSHLLDVWVAYRYWQNKLGLDHNNALACRGAAINSCTESSVYTGVTVKF